MVISDRWILTAAHVVTGSEGPVSVNNVRVSDVHRSRFECATAATAWLISCCGADLQIYLGLNDVRNLSVNPVHAASIHIHPGYVNPNLNDYNNDIALLKLQHPITFGLSVMPICLPAEDSVLSSGHVG